MANTRKLRSSSGASLTREIDPFLVALGQRVRSLRDRNGITRKALAAATGVSERHLANLEYGEGNVSVLVLEQVATALQCPLAELIGDFTTHSPEWLMIRSLLENCDEATLHKVRLAIGHELGTLASGDASRTRIALIGLRGAGKSTLGAMLAETLDFPFVELSRQIEQFAGCTIAEIQDLYGANAYRRYERRALEETIQIYPDAVISTPGGLVSDAVNFNLLLSHCTTVWLQADPEDHMQRVIDQGDFRPMAGTREKTQSERTGLLGIDISPQKAHLQMNTSAQPLDATFDVLLGLLNDNRALHHHPEMQYSA